MAWLCALVLACVAAGAPLPEPNTEAVRLTTAAPTLQSPFGPVRTPLSLELSNFLLDHPDLAAYLVRRHKIAPYRIRMRGPRESWADDGQGTQGVITMLERGENHRAYFGYGIHESRVFPTVRATVFIELQVRENGAPDCPPTVESLFHVSLRLKSQVVAALLKALRPFVRRTVTRIFLKAFLVADQVGRLMEAQPEQIEKEALSYPELSAAERDAFGAMMARFKTRLANTACPKASG